MNGEISQMCNLVIAAKKALVTHSEIEDIKLNYISHIQFSFLSEKTLLGNKQITVSSVRDWFSRCRKRKLEDIKLILPKSVKDRGLLGFANSNNGAVICFWKSGRKTYFLPHWEFDRSQKGWNVLYQEYESEFPNGKPEFQDRTAEFKQILQEIEQFAIKIGYEDFAKCFQRAYNSLCGNTSESRRAPSVPDVPEEFKNIYIAIMDADVFGGMGSWNDSPPYSAHVMNLEKEYNALSDRLLYEIRYHIMYLANECWNC